MALGPYEAGLTPEEREQREQPPGRRNPMLGAAYVHRGTGARLAIKRPLLALALSGMLGPQKMASFNNELEQIMKEAGWFDRISDSVAGLTRSGSFGKSVSSAGRSATKGPSEINQLAEEYLKKLRQAAPPSTRKSLG